MDLMPVLVSKHISIVDLDSLLQQMGLVTTFLHRYPTRQIHLPYIATKVSNILHLVPVLNILDYQNKNPHLGSLSFSSLSPNLKFSWSQKNTTLWAYTTTHLAESE